MFGKNIGSTQDKDKAGERLLKKEKNKKGMRRVKRLRGTSGQGLVGKGTDGEERREREGKREKREAKSSRKEEGKSAVKTDVKGRREGPERGEGFIIALIKDNLMKKK